MIRKTSNLTEQQLRVKNQQEFDKKYDPVKLKEEMEEQSIKNEKLIESIIIKDLEKELVELKKKRNNNEKNNIKKNTN